jgi:hypothetical protein
VPVSLVTRWFALAAAYAWYDWATQFKDDSGYVGPDWFKRYAVRTGSGLRGDGRRGGLIPGFDTLECDDFNPREVHALIRDFYRNSARFTLQIVRNRWNPTWRPFAPLLTPILQRIGQLCIPVETTGTMVSEYQLLDIDKDGRHDFVCWIRGMASPEGGKPEPFYTGAFRPFHSVVDGTRSAFLACAFPVPFANVAAVLKFSNTPNGGFRASSLPAPLPSGARRGFAEAGSYIGSREAGTYVVVPFRRSLYVFPAFGLEEDFRFRVDEDADGPRIRGIHRCLWLGSLLFRLDYVIRLQGPAKRTRT